MSLEPSTTCPALCVAGTYDGGIVGWDVDYAPEDGGDGSLKMVSLYE